MTIIVIFECLRHPCVSRSLIPAGRTKLGAPRPPAAGWRTRSHLCGRPCPFVDDCATCDEDFGSADEQAEYMGSLPEGRRPSPGKLKQLKARFSSEDKRYSESSAVAMVRRSGGGGGGVW